MHKRSRLVIPAAVAALSLSLTACGSKSDDKAAGSGSSSAPAQVPATNPLTGLPMSDSEQAHPPYIVKIDNTAASDPQIGIGSADLVTQELVEGGLTRLAVFFYDNLPQKVGPVRSMRATDVGVAKPIGASIVTSGAAQFTLHAISHAGITYLDMNNPNVVRVSDGQHDSLHSVMANLAAIGKAAHKKPARPADYLPFGDQALPQGRAATSIDVRFSGGVGSDWKYDGKHYLLQNGFMGQGDVFAPDTLIAATVTTTTAPYKDPAGNPVPISHFEGSGKALIFHDGQVVKATWEKKNEGDAVTFKDASGKELEIPAGHVWLSLVPGKGDAGAGSVTFTK
ncbi:DUF3048 domain-containing protein [Nocardioides montaniterrae]